MKNQITVILVGEPSEAVRQMIERRENWINKIKDKTLVKGNTPIVTAADYLSGKVKI